CDIARFVTIRGSADCAACDLQPKLVGFTSSLLQIFLKLGHSGQHVVPRSPKAATECVDQDLGLTKPLVCIEAGDCSYATNSGGNRFVAGYLEQADITGCSHVGAAAKLFGKDFLDAFD